jgi:FKBP-type peptidyl-prolyl cis-trans isomerase
MICLACHKKAPEYKSINDSFAYKYISIGEEASIQADQTVFANLIITSLSNDTIHYVPDYPYLIKIGNTSLDSLFTQFNVGDSLIIKGLRTDLLEKFKFFQLMQSTEDTVLVHLKFLKAFDGEFANNERQRLLSLREVKEQEQLQEYLKAHENEYNQLGGIYRKIIEKSEGNLIKNDSEISLHYRGSFLDGFVFDDTYKKGITPSFTYGREFQLLEGIQIGLKGLKEGERAKIILPSQLAFKEGGSLAGIVPPYTAVIFEIEIIKVIN